MLFSFVNHLLSPSIPLGFVMSPSPPLFHRPITPLSLTVSTESTHASSLQNLGLSFNSSFKMSTSGTDQGTNLIARLIYPLTDLKSTTHTHPHQDSGLTTTLYRNQYFIKDRPIIILIHFLFLNSSNLFFNPKL